MFSFLGGAVERLKNPKNVFGWLVAGYVLVVIGYLIWHKFEIVGKLFGFLGCLAILLPLVRLGLTKIIYGIVIAALLVGYYYWYSHSVSMTENTSVFSYEHDPWREHTRVRKMPKYGDSKLGQKVTEFAFAPAFMFDSTIRFRRWGTSDTVTGQVFRTDFGTE